MKNFASNVFTTIFGWSFVLAVSYGWLANLYQLVSSDYGFAMFSVKVVGIFFAPLGSVLGLFGSL